MEARLPKDAAGNFIAGQEKSDVLHDLLAHLAEKMLEANMQKQQEIRDPLGCSAYVGANVEDLTPKTKLQVYYEHDYESFLADPQEGPKEAGRRSCPPGALATGRVRGVRLANWDRSWRGSRKRTG